MSENLKGLRLSRASQNAATAVVVVVMCLAFLVGLTGAGYAFFNLFSGRDEDTAVAAQLVFVGFVVMFGSAIVIGVCLGAIAGIDLAVRGVRKSLRRRFANPS